MDAPTLAPPPPRQDTNLGDLVLCVRNPAHDGQLVRLRSAKCTLGSGDQCTLRLRAAGVAPIHCTIVRNSRAAVVRGWSPDTRLNGSPFTDARLSVGDRLAVGPIELEVVSLGVDLPQPPTTATTSPEIQPPENANSNRDAEQASLHREQLDQERQQLAAQRIQLDEERSALDADREALDRRQRQFLADQQNADREREELQNRIAAEQAEIAAARAALDEDRLALDVQRQAVEQQRRQWLAEQQDADGQFHLDRQTLAGQQEALAADKQSLQTLQETLAAERKALQAQQEALAADKKTFEVQQEVFAADKKTFETRQEALATDRKAFETRQEAFIAEKNAFHTQQDAFVADKRNFQSQQEAFAAEKNDLQAQLAALAADRRTFESQRESFIAEQKNFRAQQEALAVDKKTFCSRQEVFTTEEEALRTQREALVVEREAFVAEREKLTAERGELQTVHDVLARERAAIDERRRAWLDEQQAARNQWEERRAELAREPAETEPSTPATDEEDLRFDEPARSAPVDLADVLRRLGKPVEAVEDEPHRSDVEETDARFAPLPEFSPTTTHDVTGEEESIDDYMNRLMSRVRAVSTEARDSSSSPAAAPTAASDASRDVAPAKSTPARVAEPISSSSSPRSTAPEKRADLSTLRELANLAAHTAISRHTHRVLKSDLYSKLIIAIAAFTGGGGLLWMWRQHGALSMTLYAGVIALSVGVYWGIEYIFLTRRIAANRAHAKQPDAALPEASDSKKPGENQSPSAETVGCDPPAAAASDED